MVLPLTHFLRIVRGILLKGNEVNQLTRGTLADVSVLIRRWLYCIETLSSNLRLTSHNLPNKTRMFNMNTHYDRLVFASV